MLVIQLYSTDDPMLSQFGKSRLDMVYQNQNFRFYCIPQKSSSVTDIRHRVRCWALAASFMHECLASYHPILLHPHE